MVTIDTDDGRPWLLWTRYLVFMNARIESLFATFSDERIVAFYNDPKSNRLEKNGISWSELRALRTVMQLRRFTKFYERIGNAERAELESDLRPCGAAGKDLLAKLEHPEDADVYALHCRYMTWLAERELCFLDPAAEEGFRDNQRVLPECEFLARWRLFVVQKGIVPSITFFYKHGTSSDFEQFDARLNDAMSGKRGPRPRR